jgi:glycosyltransferase involved in cell wall biosynthesis
MVVVNTIEEFEKWKATEGFKQPSPEQIGQYQLDRQKMYRDSQIRQNIAANMGTGVYMLTVSPDGADGYSNSARLMTRELERIGIGVSQTYKGQKIGFLFHNPYSLPSMRTEYKILYTMFESDKLPDDWMEPLEYADKILVPSTWCQSVFKKAGFEAEVVPLGYDNDMFQPVERSLKEETHDNFTFLHYNAFNIRKGFPEVFKAFVKEFRQDEPVRMIFKSTLDRMPLPILHAQYPNIEMIMGKVSDYELSEIIARSDCFVFPSRGEGFGITPLETMATGMPAIVPNAHGISEYFNAEVMYEVNVKETCPGLYSRYKNQDVGNMVVCDIDHLAAQMRYVYEHQKEAREKGRKASEYVQQYTFKKTAELLKVIFDKVASDPSLSPKIKNVLTLEKVR